MNLEPNKETVLTQTITKLLDYCQRNNWSGYDPYDALNCEIFLKFPFLNTKLPRLVLTQVLKRSPVNFRPLLLVPKTRNPKAIALFLMAFLKLGNKDDLVKIMIDSLIRMRSPDASYWCWGYSFPWQGRTVLVSKSAPNLVCTVFVANALLDVYEANQDARCLTMATSAAEYILNELYWTTDTATAGFSYPLPALQAQVHNANFLAAALLCRIHKHTGEEKFLEPAMRAARYSASKQHADGAWDYGELPTQRWIDNFHTGYNLCALRAIDEYLDTDEFEPNIRLGFTFYRNHFFRDDGAPKYFDNGVYPVDIHSVAQSIITLTIFHDLNEHNISLANSVLEWAVANMWDERGYFYYQMTPYYKNKISYMRWSQAWMLLALATLLKHIESPLGP